MEITFFHKNLTKAEEGSFAEYVETKREMIENLLKTFPENATLMRANIEKFEKHDAYEVELAVIMPTKQVVAKEASHMITKAVDLAKDRLVSQIKKHIALMRRERKHKSVRERKEVGIKEEVLF
ncbi:MAG: HPF/RaiA family ribosome-associated protein [Candidatus Peregrinibacteria bacterium]|nr:HPF/RaiA family ribosome-associated protein [Candidatus Peregrinibacteria bacterium]